MSHQVYIYIVYTVIHHWFVPNPGKSHWQDLVDQTVWKHLHCWTSILDNPRHISLNCMNLCQTTCRFICRNRCAMEQHQCISEYTGNWESFLVVGLNFIFPYWEFHHPNWRSHIFQRGRYTTNQLYLLLMSSFIRNSHVWCFRIANFHTEVGGQHGGLDSSTLLQADEAINDEARGWWAGDSDLVMTDGERRSIAKLVKITRFTVTLVCGGYIMIYL